MKLKGWRKFEKKINNIFSKTLDDGITIKLNSDDSYSFDKRIIYFGVLRSTEADNNFVTNLKQTCPDILDLPAYMYCILHEIGHSKTHDYLIKDDRQVRATIMEKGTDAEYFALPAEKVATEWAIEYIQKHKYRVVNMTVILDKAIRKFIEKNTN